MLKRTESALAERLAPEEVPLDGGEEPPAPVFLGGADRREEMERIARLILSLSADEGRRPDDFLLLMRETDPYRAVLAGVFRGFRIPYRGRFQAAAVSTPPGRSLLDCLAIARGGVTRETVDALLKNRMFAVDADLADRIVRSWSGTPEPEDGEALLREAAETNRGFATERIEPLLRFVRETREAKGGDAIRILRDSWLEWIEPSLHAEAFPSGDLPLVGAAVTRLAGLLDRAAAAFDREPELAAASPAVLFELLEEEVARARVSFVDGEGGVRIDDFRHGQNLRAPVVFVAGLDAGLCPRPYDPGSFWTESDRERLNATGQYRIPDRSLHADEERYLFHRACTRATERLYLTAPSFQPDGKACAGVARSGSRSGASSRRGVSRISARSSGSIPPARSPPRAISFRFSPPAPIRRSGIGEGSCSRPRSSRRRGSRRRPSPRSFRDPVRLGGVRAVRAWLRDRREFSVTELEDFQACPYRYFAKYVLSLREPDEEAEHAFPIVVEGEVLHRVLEEAEGSPDRSTRSSPRALEEARGPFAEHLGHRLAEEDLRASLRALIEEDLAFRSEHGWLPHAFEYTFGADAKKPVRVGGSVPIRGRIDRIDFALGGEIAVVDYKRSAARKSEVERGLSEGQSLALPLYILAASELLGRRPAGAFLLGVRQTRRSGFYDLSLAEKGIVPDKKNAGSAMALDPALFAETIEQASLQARRTSEGIGTGEFPVEPVDERVCTRLHCPYRDLCRIVHAAAGEEEPE